MPRKKPFRIGAAVGSGVVARAAEAGGADFLLAINAGRIRNMGMPSIASMLPIRDAWDATMPFAEREVLPQAKVPVYIGMPSWSKTPVEAEIRSVLDAGFAGVANFPSSMHYSKAMRRLLDRSGMGTQAEIAMMRRVQAAGGQTLFYCGTLDEARAAAEGALNAVVFNFGWNVGGADSHTTKISLEEAAQRAREVSRQVRRLRPDMEVYLEGGPILTAEDLNFVIRYAQIDGYVGGSTIDRFPVQNSVANQIAEYKSAAQTIGAKERELQDALTEAARHGLYGQSDELARFAASLIRAREGTGHVFLTVPHGADLNAAIALLTAVRSRPSIESHDFSQASHAHLSNDLLFGRDDGRASRKMGILHSDVDFVLLLFCEAMPRLVQRKLHTAMNTGQLQFVGSRVSHVFSPRLVLVSNGPPPDSWADLPLTHIVYPSLKERHIDVRMILEQAMTRMTSEDRIPTIRPAAYRVLSAHDWVGNDAELRALAQALVGQSAQAVYEAKDMRQLLAGSEMSPEDNTATEAKREQLLQALARNGFRKGDTAHALNISRKTLYNQMKRFGLS